jgi:hypothetical protein
MQLNNWKLYDKSGSPVNWQPEPYLPLTFTSDVSSAGADGYLITDPTGTVVNSEITNSGFYYTPGTTVSYDYIFDGTTIDITSKTDITYTDVSIFNPDPVNTQGIGSLTIDSLENLIGILDFNGDSHVSMSSLGDNIFLDEFTVKFDLLLDFDFGFSGGLFQFDSLTDDGLRCILLDSSIFFISGQYAAWGSIIGQSDQPSQWEITHNTGTYPSNFKIDGVDIPLNHTASLVDTSLGGIKIGSGGISLYNGEGVSDMESASIWNIVVEDANSEPLFGWQGYPAGNTDTAWADLYGTLNGTYDEGKATVATLRDIVVDSSIGNLAYPSTTYSSALFLEPVSQGLVETEHLFIFQDQDSSLIRPYDASYGTLIVQTYGDDDEIKLFTVDEDTQEITWTDQIEYDLSEYVEGVPLSINVGFKSDDEGVYERSLRFYNRVDTNYYLLGEILVNAESIGEDERFRTLLSNFGLPDPKDIPKMFKEADINEDLPDYKIVNPASKLMILEHHNIMPYIGTYKALVNALKWLGYDDIYIKEWFLDVTSNTKKSLHIPYDASERTQTILKFSADERKTLKKLNQLSLNYCLTRETGDIDDWGTPETENCYTYNIKEVLVKLFALKEWLEKKIIGVNARIIDLTGEGIYFERFTNLIYSTGLVGYNYSDEQSVTPITEPQRSELITGEASINLSLLEFSQTRIEDLPYKFSEFVDYVWDPSTGETLSFSDTTTTGITDASGYLYVGPPISHPFVGIKDIQYKASVINYYSGVLQNTHVTSPLWIYNNEIKFYDIFDTSAVFYDVSVNLDILLEKAHIRDASNSNWPDASSYSIYPNNYLYMDASSTRLITVDSSYAIITGSGTVYDGTSSFTYNIENDIYLDPSYFNVDSSIFIIADTSTTIQSNSVTGWVMESSIGTTWDFDDYVSLQQRTDASSLLQYAYDDVYGVPLLGFKNYQMRDASDNIFQFETDKFYFINILDGKIAMDASISPEIRQYINFEKDDITEKQTVRLNVEYISDRMPLYVIDPSSYYWADPSGFSGFDDASILAIDNSTFSMAVNHKGRYNIEANAFDGYNINYYNIGRDYHSVYMKSPIIYSLVDASSLTPTYDSSSYISMSEAQTLVDDNKYPIFDRLDKFKALEFVTNGSNSYVNAPNVTYFHELPVAGDIEKYFNMTERASSIVDSSLSVIKKYQDFIEGDDVQLVYYDKGSYFNIDEVSTHIVGVSGSTLSLDQIPSDFVIDSSHDIFLLNSTQRYTENGANDPSTSTFTIDISGYTFLDNQLVALLIVDGSTSYSMSASCRVLSTDGSTHTFGESMPSYILADSSKYTITARHAHATFTDFQVDVSSALDSNDNFQFYYNKEYMPYTVDNTFVSMNLPFDQAFIRDQWYDDSLSLVNSDFYKYQNEVIGVDVSTLVLLVAEYDTSSYMLNQKNSWIVVNTDNNEVVMRVHNKSIPFTFGEDSNYEIFVESYDSHGNLMRS